MRTQHTPPISFKPNLNPIGATLGLVSLVALGVLTAAVLKGRVGIPGSILTKKRVMIVGSLAATGLTFSVISCLLGRKPAGKDALKQQTIDSQSPEQERYQIDFFSKENTLIRRTIVDKNKHPLRVTYFNDKREETDRFTIVGDQVSTPDDTNNVLTSYPKDLFITEPSEGQTCEKRALQPPLPPKEEKGQRERVNTCPSTWPGSSKTEPCENGKQPKIRGVLCQMMRFENEWGHLKKSVIVDAQGRPLRVDDYTTSEKKTKSYYVEQPGNQVTKIVIFLNGHPNKEVVLSGKKPIGYRLRKDGSRKLSEEGVVDSFTPTEENKEIPPGFISTETPADTELAWSTEGDPSLPPQPWSHFLHLPVELLQIILGLATSQEENGPANLLELKKATQLSGTCKIFNAIIRNYPLSILRERAEKASLQSLILESRMNEALNTNGASNGERTYTLLQHAMLVKQKNLTVTHSFLPNSPSGTVFQRGDIFIIDKNTFGRKVDINEQLEIYQYDINRKQFKCIHVINTQNQEVTEITKKGGLMIGGQLHTFPMGKNFTHAPLQNDEITSCHCISHTYALITTRSQQIFIDKYLEAENQQAETQRFAQPLDGKFITVIAESASFLIKSAEKLSRYTVENMTYKEEESVDLPSNSCILGCSNRMVYIVSPGNNNIYLEQLSAYSVSNFKNQWNFSIRACIIGNPWKLLTPNETSTIFVYNQSGQADLGYSMALVDTTSMVGGKPSLYQTWMPGEHRASSLIKLTQQAKRVGQLRSILLMTIDVNNRTQLEVSGWIPSCQGAARTFQRIRSLGTCNGTPTLSERGVLLLPRSGHTLKEIVFSDLGCN